MIRCDYFENGVCRSCSEIRTPYGAQLREKDALARAALGHLGQQAGGCRWSSAVSSSQTGFRNRAKMVVTGTMEEPRLGILGDDLEGVDLTGCLLCAPPIRESFVPIIEFVRRARIPPYDVRGRKGELKFVLVTLGENRGLMVRFVLRSDEAVVRIRKHLAWLLENLPSACVVSVNLQPLPSAIVEGKTEIVLTEASCLRMSFGGHPILLPPGGFFQTNTEVAAELYRRASGWVREIEPSSLLDLYCGVGGFALHVAQAMGAGERAGESVEGAEAGSPKPRRCQIRGVELHPDAVAAANQSAVLWGLRDVRFEVGDATGLALEAGRVPELVIVNPPRRGIGGELCQVLESSAVERIVYSSCNVDSLVRDVGSLPSFRVERAVVLDMFPHTRHFETLISLARR